MAGVINDDPSRPVNLTARGRLQTSTAVEGLVSVPFTLTCPDGVVLAVSHENPIIAAALVGRDPEEASRSGLGNCDWVVLNCKS